MILRRFMQHVREQNWFAVWLDVIVVIVGIFLGLQIQALYEERDERDREMDYLERLHEDIEQNIVVIEESIKNQLVFQEMGKFVLQTFEHPELVNERPTYFILSIEAAAYATPPNISYSTFEALNLNGDRLIFSDEQLLYELTDYYNAINRSPVSNHPEIPQLQLNYFMISSGILTSGQLDEINVKGPFSDDFQFSEEEALAVYERMLGRPDFKNFLPRATGHNFRIRIYQQWLVQAKVLRDKIKHKLTLMPTQ